MEKSYLIKIVPPYFTNKTKEIAKQPKIYFIDTGLRNVIIGNYRTELDGRLFENYVFTELIKLDLLHKINYWRTKAKAEVDFIVKNNEEIIPIEVKLHAEPNKIERSLRSFIKRYRPKRAIVVIYKGTEGEKEVNGCKVIFTNIMGLHDIFKSDTK